MDPSSGDSLRPAHGTRVVRVIDPLGSGGARRSLVLPAIGLKGRGYDVEVLVY